MTSHRPSTAGLPGRPALTSRHAMALHRAIGVLPVVIAAAALANPHGMTVTSGTATATTSGTQLTITTSQAALLNWQSFNIGTGETTTFVMPSSSSVVFNQIGGMSPSQIWGNLNANGTVVLMNPSGFYFGPNCEIKTGGFVATTATPEPGFTSGSQWEFTGPPPAASIVNYGRIEVQSGGSLFLNAAEIDNHGVLSAPGGAVGLYADRQVLVSDRPDGRGLNVSVKLPVGAVNNDGQIIADGGTIMANAQTVNQNGLIQANSVQEKNGVIELVADDSVNLGANSVIQANGGSSGVSDGGQITIKSGNTFSDTSGSLVSATGGAQGGDGGTIDISAPNITSLNSTLTAVAQSGYTAGLLFFDPYNIILDSSGTGSASGGTVLAGSGTTGSTLDLNVNTAFQGFSQITLQAMNNITLASGTSWSLSDSTGQTTGKLTLEAGNNIIFQDGSSIYDANNWSVAMLAGVNNFATGTVQTGLGYIYLNGGAGLPGGGSIETTTGSISLTAGHDIQMGYGSLTDNNFNGIALASVSGPISVSAGNTIQVSAGFIETTGGGNINMAATQDIDMANGFITATGGGNIQATAGPGPKGTSSLNIGSEFIQTDSGSITLTAQQNITITSGAVTTIGGGGISATATTGSVNTGKDANGYLFTAPSPNGKVPGGAQVNLLSLGGISTGAGGNVSITAGQNVTSYLPTGSNPAGDAGSGAFGPEQGNVTITAGGNVTGHYVVANGIGTITTGGSAGTSSQQLALSLIDGSWNVNANQSITLQEVRNPDGIFNNRGSSTTPSYHQFNYGADDSVTLDAGTSVELTGSSLPRNPGEVIPTIYPGSLTINSGTGVKLDNELILFPSPEGSLSINTGGSLSGPSALNPTPLIMSDSAATQYINSSTFGLGDHAPIPIHLNSPTTCELTIGGDMDNIYLVTPEAATLTVAGNMNNCAFRGQNLHPGDVTSLNVTGNIFNLNNFSSVSLHLPSAPNLALLNQAYGASFSELFNRLTYNNGTLTLQGQMTPQEVAALFSLQIQVYNSAGQPEFDPHGNPILQTVHILNPNDPAVVTAINTLRTESLGVPNIPGAGYALGGPGLFNVQAHNMDLGATLGIQSVGPLNNSSLAPYCYNPASPTVNGAAVDVTLTGNLDMFSTTICSLAGGNVTVSADAGYINVGSSFVPTDTFPRGIFSAGAGNVSVTAGTDINVNGSRIAAYDGGNVTVESLTGNVNAGSGAQGACTVEQAAIVPIRNPRTGQIVSYQVETYAPVIPGSGILATTFPPPIGVQFPNRPTTVGNITVDTPQGNIIANTGGIIQLPLNGIISSTATVTLEAGTKNQDGTVLYQGKIDASGSGVIGANVDLQATAGITGVIVAQQNLSITAGQNVSVTAIAAGNVNIAAGGIVSGTIVGVGGINATAGTIDASLLSQNVSTSGNVSGGQMGFAQANVAGATSQAASSDNQSQTAVTAVVDNPLDDQKNKKRPTLNKTGRVTVVLPDKT